MTPPEEKYILRVDDDLLIQKIIERALKRPWNSDHLDDGTDRSGG